MVSVHWRILLMATVRFPDVTRRGKLVAAAVVLLFAQISFLVLESPIRFSAFLVARRRLLWHWFCWPAGLLAARTGRVCRSGLPIRRSTSAITCSCVMPRTTLPVTCSGPQLGSAGLRPIQRLRSTKMHDRLRPRLLAAFGTRDWWILPTDSVRACFAIP